jgi:dTDP-4-amino-4,6-dideoxygalactose transaminase
MARSTKLAIDGGLPTVANGPPVWPVPDEEVLLALQSVYQLGDWGRYHGEFSTKLSHQLAMMHGTEHVVLCSSGTLAVELALRGLKIGSGDEVILAGYDFSGNFRAIEAVGAFPVLVDINATDCCLSLEAIAEGMSTRCRAIIVSHLHGGLAAMKAIRALADDRGCFIIEDACQAQGATVEGKIAGSWGDVGVLSFGGSKLLTAGRGGALLIQRHDVYQRVKIYCERGNHAFPLSELQAAVLIPQLAKLQSRNLARQASVKWLRNQLAEFEFLRPLQNGARDCEPAYYKLGWSYQDTVLQGRSRTEFLAAIQAEGVAMGGGFQGFVKRPASRCRRMGDMPASRRAAETTVLLHHPVLLKPANELQRVVDAIAKIGNAWST